MGCIIKGLPIKEWIEALCWLHGSTLRQHMQWRFHNPCKYRIGFTGSYYHYSALTAGISNILLSWKTHRDVKKKTNNKKNSNTFVILSRPFLFNTLALDFINGPPCTKPEQILNELLALKLIETKTFTHWKQPKRSFPKITSLKKKKTATKNQRNKRNKESDGTKLSSPRHHVVQISPNSRLDCELVVVLLLLLLVNDNDSGTAFKSRPTRFKITRL